MAAPKTAARKPRKKEKKNIAVGQAHIKSTFNNTIVSITDTTGAVISWASSGGVGFKRVCRNIDTAIRTGRMTSAAIFGSVRSVRHSCPGNCPGCC